MKHLFTQIFHFGIVGFLCFFIDYGLLLLFTEVFGISYLISSALSFTVSVFINYLLSLTFVFDAKKDANKLNEFIVFVVLSVIGLGINQLLMWFIVEKLHIMYQIAKIGVTAIVMIYNFISRKLFLEKK